MSANNYLPHLVVLPEDDANRQLLVGFRNHHAVNSRQMPIQPIAKGWLKAVETFLEEHVVPMRSYPKRHFLMVVDFDNQLDRRDDIVSQIPTDLLERFYILGCSDEPERLIASLGTKFEAVGESLALDCVHNTNETWNHAMLAHNASELERLRVNVKPFLFPQG